MIKPRIGIFQADWPLQSQTISCAIVIAQSGYDVDLFLYQTVEIYDLDELRKFSNINIYSLSKLYNGVGFYWTRPASNWYPWTRTFLDTISSKALGFRRVLLKPLREACDAHLLRNKRADGIIPTSIMRKTMRLMKGHQYRCLIGIEKAGLVWAGQLANTLDVPYFYYSLELYTWDHPVATSSTHARYLKVMEEKFHQLSDATIVQDAQRAECLLRDNGVQSGQLLFVPVSILGQSYKYRPSFLQKRFNLKDSQLVVLQFGGISEERFSIELARLAQDFHPDLVLVLHGWGPPASIRRIKEIDTSERVVLSLEREPVTTLHELIASAHIGLVLYGNSTTNDYLTAFSSEKLALYLRCGLPVIAFNYPGYEIIESYRCGILLKSIDELHVAIELILESYNEFRSNAYKCFDEKYQFSKNFRKVIDALDGLA